MDWNSGMDSGTDYGILKKNVYEHFALAIPDSAVLLFTY